MCPQTSESPRASIQTLQMIITCNMGLKRKTPLKRTPIKKTPWDKAKKEQEKKKAKAGLSKPALIKKLDRRF